MRQPLILVLGVTLFHCLSGHATEVDARQNALKLFGPFSVPKPDEQTLSKDPEDHDCVGGFVFEMDKSQKNSKHLNIPKETNMGAKVDIVKPNLEHANVLDSTTQTINKKFEYCINNADFTLGLEFPNIDSDVPQKRFERDWMVHSSMEQKCAPVSTYLHGWFMVPNHIQIHKLNWLLYQYSLTKPEWTDQGLQLTFCYLKNNGRDTGHMIYPNFYISYNQIYSAIGQFRKGRNFQYTFQLEPLKPVVNEELEPLDAPNNSTDEVIAYTGGEKSFQRTSQLGSSTPVVKEENRPTMIDNHSPD